jgi:TetR/AcrR family transcriptional repressor of nem operon
MPMRKSKQETAKTRERIVRAAAGEFREHGIVATGLADLMAAAGLTHGGFYRHFDSKDQLVAETCALAVAELTQSVAATGSTKKGRKGLEAAVSAYLSPQHRDNCRDGCPIAALGSELARADEETRANATEGFMTLVSFLADRFEEAKMSDARKRAVAAATTMIGALTISRIVTDEALSASILNSAKDGITRQ